MKTKLLMLLMLIGAMTLQSCNDNDDDLLITDVPTAVLRAFEQDYASTTAKWELTGGLYNAEFWNQGVETDVWYQADGTWVRTEIDYNGVLPTAIQEYLTANYSGYAVDDADLISTPSGSYYELELEKSGAADVTLRITSEGVVVSG